MQRWQLVSGLPLCARPSNNFAPLQTRPPLLSSATRRRITFDGDVPGFLGYAKLQGTRVHPAFGPLCHFLLSQLLFSYLFRPHPRYANTGFRMYIRDS
jgi:hypothetical protein